MVDPMHFDDVAAGYGAARPPYPEELWRDVESTGRVVPGGQVLDLGAGSGEATAQLLARGMDAVAVEPGARLADLLEQHCPRATVIRSRAEDIRLDADSFDLVVAATSIHWMDLDVVLPIVHHVLRTRGRFLVWRNVFGDVDAAVTPFRRVVERIVQRRGSVRAGHPDDVDVIAERIAASALFTITAIHRYRWTTDLTSDEVGALFGTFSDWSPREVEEAVAAVVGLGGSVTEHYTSWLIEASPIQ